MIRLGISVEGATEREFVNRIVRPHLAGRGVQVAAIDLRGNVSLDKIRGVLPALMASFDRVSTFYDLYGFKGRAGRSVDELEAAITDLLEAEARHRLIPYVQQYEFEALLFAVPNHCREWLSGSAQALQSMQQAVREAGSPERVNDRPETSPSHRLKSLFPGYDKKLHGPEIVELGGLPAIREQCVRFNQWLLQLEALAGQ